MRSRLGAAASLPKRRCLHLQLPDKGVTPVGERLSALKFGAIEGLNDAALSEPWRHQFRREPLRSMYLCWKLNCAQIEAYTSRRRIWLTP